MIKYIIEFSYLNNVTILQDGRHSEPLFEKWLSVNKFSNMVKSHQITFVFIHISSTSILAPIMIHILQLNKL